MSGSNEIAVLMPTYQPGEYIFRALMSLHRQTLDKSRFCVYLALNGPRFPYEKQVLQFLKGLDLNYRYVYLEQAGVSFARNALIDVSTEPFVTFFDDDDVLSDNFLENLLAVSSEQTIGVSNVRNFEKDISERRSNYIGNAFDKLDEVEESKFRARKYFSSPCAKLIHRRMIANVRFDIRLNKGEDAYFMAQISPRVQAVKKADRDTFYFVCERAGSATRQQVNATAELRRVCYLIVRYLKMLSDSHYERAFILSRVLATFFKLKSILPFRGGDSIR